MTDITRNRETNEYLRLSADDWSENITLVQRTEESGHRMMKIPGEALSALHAEIGKVLAARAEREKNLEQIASLTADQVVQSYSGRPGCACGCKGTYSTRPNTIKLVLARLQEHAPGERNRNLIVGSNGRGGMFFSVDTETWRGTPRAYTVYVGPGWVEETATKAAVAAVEEDVVVR